MAVTRSPSCPPPPFCQFYECLPESAVEDLKHERDFECPKVRQHAGRRRLQKLSSPQLERNRGARGEEHRASMFICSVKCLKKRWGPTGAARCGQALDLRVLGQGSGGGQHGMACPPTADGPHPACPVAPFSSFASSSRARLGTASFRVARCARRQAQHGSAPVCTCWPARSDAPTACVSGSLALACRPRTSACLPAGLPAAACAVLFPLLLKLKLACAQYAAAHAAPPGVHRQD